ncbi:hypothetical protein Pcinc_014394 [Petrolisthes cinctipes]|uniref:Endonuclease/exonuclease/phosphatase domain-containing protein n=1 Tax=Petrolisthes cinctipes TaxID=88211 RepID=A0AAE1FX25_PETCI|nr:hypothetical protein Pcinc_014394 [Petrolisthes cinctipes]
MGNPEPSVIINGDFNLPNANWHELSIYGGSLADRLQANALYNMVEDLMMRQIVDLPTRGLNTLDLFFTNNEDIISGVRTEDTTMSDHKLLIVETTLEYRPMIEINGSGCSSFSTMNFFSENMDWTSMNNAITIVNWNQELKDMTTIEMYDFIIEKLLFICSRFVPERKVHRRISNIPRDRKILVRKRTKLAERILHREDSRIKEQLSNIEEKLAKSHEAERIADEEKAVEAISRNPKYFYHYAKTKSKMTLDF